MKKRRPVIRRTKPAPDRERRIPTGLEELFGGGDGELREPFCCFFPLTKEIAADWFANHLNPEKQRSLSDKTINELLRMQAGDLWTDYKAQVVFDTRWEVRNGQHVLASLIRSETHDGFIIQLLVNLPPIICDSWDLVRKRSAADEFKIKGVVADNRYALSKAAKVLWQYQHGIYEGMGYLFDRGTIAVAPEAVKTAELNPDLRESIYPVDKCFKGKQFSMAAVHAAYCILHRFDQKKAETFFRSLNIGVGLMDKDNPIWALRNRFLSMGPKDRLRNGETMALVFKAWNLYRDGAKVKGSLKMGKNEPFPLLEPMEVPNGPHSGRVQ